MKKSREKNSVQIYLKQIEKIPVLSRQEERECAEKILEGDQKAKEKLIVSNLKFVVSIAVRYQGLGLPLTDLVNEGNMGLMRAVDKFDVKKGYKFISYARWWIRHYILKAIFEQSTSIKVPLKYAPQLSNNYQGEETDTAKELKKVYRPVSLDQKISADDNSDTTLELIDDNKNELPDEQVMDRQLQEAINQAMGRLKPIERDVIIRHFGLNGKAVHTLKKIGDRYNLTKERIRQIEQAGLSKLRYPLEKRRATDFVD
ncbi:MAG: sigma-70 family RNA polymerase sigma factor [Spirochaetota bacterium]